MNQRTNQILIFSKSEHVRERPLFVFIVHCIGATALIHSTLKPNMAVKAGSFSVIAVHSLLFFFAPTLFFAGPVAFESAGTLYLRRVPFSAKSCRPPGSFCVMNSFDLRAQCLPIFLGGSSSPMFCGTVELHKVDSRRCGAM